jgi:hypothetical protein
MHEKENAKLPRATLVSSAHGFDDYYVEGIPTVRRVTIGHGIRKGQGFNVYCDDSRKIGGIWKGTLGASLKHLAARLATEAAQARNAPQSVQYVIHSLSERQADQDGKVGAFWSNEEGWGGFESATRFSTAERMSNMLPISTRGDSEWMLVEEAQELTDIAKAKAAGFTVHQGAHDDEDVSLRGRWWWVLGQPGWSDYETAEGDFATEREAWADAVRTLRDNPELSANGPEAQVCAQSANAAIAARLLVTVDQSDGLNVLVALAPEGMAKDEATDVVRACADEHAEHSDLMQDLSERGFVVFSNFVTVDIN